jgi:hypothetical protein
MFSKLRIFGNFFLLICLFPLLVHSEEFHLEINPLQEKLEFNQFQIPVHAMLSFDDLVELLESIEEGELDDLYSEDDLTALNYYLVFLATKGKNSSYDVENAILEQDIQELLRPEENDQYQIAVFNGYTDIYLCKNIFAKSWSKTKRFVKKHKKAILIGVAVVGIAIGVYALVVPSLATASESTDKKASDKSEEPLVTSLPSVQVENIIEYQINEFKEEIEKERIFNPSDISDPDSELTALEKLKNLGSNVAHDTFEAIGEPLEDISRSLNQVIDLHNSVFSDCKIKSFSSDEISLITSHQKMMKKGHQIIDKIFSTNGAPRYNPEERVSNPSRTVYGVIPFGPSSSSLVRVKLQTGKILPTQVSPIKGWSVGQPITNRTISGDVPKWSTVRRRYWKNRAEFSKSNPDQVYGNHNIARMEKGLAPQRFNETTSKFETLELHHDPAQRDGGLFDFIEMWPEDHAQIDPYRILGE